MRGGTRGLLFLGVLALGASTAAFAERTPTYLMAAMGDSITAASLADAHARPDLPPGADMPNNSVQPLNPLQQALMDKIEANPHGWFPFLGHLQNKATLSWSSGSAIHSHYVRLQNWMGTDGKVVVLNTAVPGEKAVGMDQQADEVVSAMASGAYKSIKYVTFLIGANDACQGTDDGVFSAQILSAMEKLNAIQQHEPIRILVSLLPRIPDLGRPEVIQMLTIARFKCGLLRDRVIKECPQLTVWNTPDDYTARVELLDRKNRVIQKTLEIAGRQFPNLEIVISSRLFTSEIGKTLLAADCFHPDQAGQEMLADELWKDQPWFH